MTASTRELENGPLTATSPQQAVAEQSIGVQVPAVHFTSAQDDVEEEEADQGASVQEAMNEHQTDVPEDDQLIQPSADQDLEVINTK